MRAGVAQALTLSGYQYALRSVRAGYVYVFFKKNSRGRNRWQVWDVSADGQLYPMANPAWAIPVADMMCRRSGHSPARLHHIVLEDPHQCETAWIAFSEHQWSDDTLKRYAEDEGLRGERMLKFEPAQLIASDGASGPSITPANVAALEAICDYSPSFDAAQLPFGSEQAKPAKISTGEGGGFDAAKLASQSTRYPSPAGRKGTAAQACDMLMLRSRKKDGTPHPGVVVALPDGVGCTLEMNGYRNDVSGRIAQYGQERALQITAINDVAGLKIALRQRTQDALDQPWEWDAARSATRLKGARSAGVNAEQMAREEDLCRRWEGDARTRAPRMYAQQRSLNVARDKYNYVIAAEWQDDHFEAFGIARPKDRAIALYPHCSRAWGNISAIQSIGGCAAYSLGRKWLPFVREAEKVFTALGLPNPSNVDLVRSSKKSRTPQDPPEFGTFFFRY